jgi:hypothetical protein
MMIIMHDDVMSSRANIPIVCHAHVPSRVRISQIVCARCVEIAVIDLKFILCEYINQGKSCCDDVRFLINDNFILCESIH